MMTAYSAESFGSAQPMSTGSFDGLDIAQRFASVARALNETPQVPVTTQRIVESAVQLIGCSWATISSAAGERPADLRGGQ
jgi:hypothetical protein